MSDKPKEETVLEILDAMKIGEMVRDGKHPIHEGVDPQKLRLIEAVKYLRNLYGPTSEGPWGREVDEKLLSILRGEK